ncbi:MAG: nucleotidyltransferase domain-containing protein [Vulcanisaeta sp.]|nr:nucleotidyltransferase domain-containing protein [Vulcanisaeta sp.]MCG2870117.1 nucleotidyltransferase domain-containing protein [Vulcanisaeta sp.]MCG2886931.1 nucleotidyltransferase domain-containing protein [Vulcanisaeta sp.]
MGVKYRYFRIDDAGRGRLIETIRSVVSEYNEVLLAVLFGSFIELDEFRDVDIGIYCRGGCWDVAVDLGVELEERVGLPFDIVDIDESPITLQLRIFRTGMPILERVPGLFERLFLRSLDYQFMISRHWEWRSANA